MFLTGDPEYGVCYRGGDEAGGRRSPVVILRKEQILVTAVLGENRRQHQDFGKPEPSTGGSQLFVRQHFPGGKHSSPGFVRCPTKGQENTPDAVLFTYLDQLREQRDLIPNFIEEALRIESPVKADFRLARRAATVGDVRVEPGTPVMLLNGAANRDPRRFDCPAEFQVERANAMEHLAFGRGAHSCPGAPLARAEGRISIERILDRMHDIRLSDEHHGPVGGRRFVYEPTWVLRGLRELHLEFTPAG